MKKHFSLCMILLLLPATPVPATIKQVTYVTGLPSLDTDKYKRRLWYKGRFDWSV